MSRNMSKLFITKLRIRVAQNAITRPLRAITLGYTFCQNTQIGIWLCEMCGCEKYDGNFLAGTIAALVLIIQETVKSISIEHDWGNLSEPLHSTVSTTPSLTAGTGSRERPSPARWPSGRRRSRCTSATPSDRGRRAGARRRSSSSSSSSGSTSTWRTGSSRSSRPRSCSKGRRKGLPITIQVIPL